MIRPTSRAVPAVTATGITGDNSATWNLTITVTVAGGKAAGVYSGTITPLCCLGGPSCARWAAAVARGGRPARRGRPGASGCACWIPRRRRSSIRARRSTSSTISRREPSSTGGSRSATRRRRPRTSSSTQRRRASAAGTFLRRAGHARDELSTWSSVSAAVLRHRTRRRLTAGSPSPSRAMPRRVSGTASSGQRCAPPRRRRRRRHRGQPRWDPPVPLVGPGGPPAADFTIGALSGRALARWLGRWSSRACTTPGGRALDVSGTVRLRAGPGGLSAGPFPANLGLTLGIGDTEPVTLDARPAPARGPVEGAITLHSGLVIRTARGP